MSDASRSDDTRMGTREQIAWAFVVLAVVTLGFMGLVLWMDWYLPAEAPETVAEAGARGDYWGGHIGGFASLAGAFLFFAALLLQQSELRLQQVELRESREVAKLQEEALRRQSVIADKASTIDRVFSLHDLWSAELEKCHSLLREHDGQLVVLETEFLEYFLHCRKYYALLALTRSLLKRSCISEKERTAFRHALRHNRIPPPDEKSALVLPSGSGTAVTAYDFRPGLKEGVIPCSQMFELDDEPADI